MAGNTRPRVSALRASNLCTQGVFFIAFALRNWSNLVPGPGLLLRTYWAPSSWNQIIGLVGTPCPFKIRVHAVR